MVERDDDGAVRLAVTAFSRGNGVLMRLGGPVARHQQAVATRRLPRRPRAPREPALLTGRAVRIVRADDRVQLRPISLVMPWSRPAV